MNAIADCASTFGEESLEDHASLDAFVETPMNAFAAFRTKGKGKGRGKLRTSNVSLQDRREIMAKIRPGRIVESAADVDIGKVIKSAQ